MKTWRAMTLFLPLAMPALLATPALAAVLTYGDKDVLNYDGYPADPVLGATLEGLAPGAVTIGQPALPHDWGFSPEVDDFPGTDRIYVGSVQTGFHDGYSSEDTRLNGPQVIVMDYSSLAAQGPLTSLTLGIGADDFQNVPFGQPFTASINGMFSPELSAVLNGLDQSGPVVQFFTIGLDPAYLSPTHELVLTIDEGGDGGDGWAIDFLTLGGGGGVVDAQELPSGLGLAQNSPNPFNPSTTISFSMPETGAAHLWVHTLAGELVRSIDLGVVARGGNSVSLDADDLASGVYVYTLQSEFGSLSRKMLLMK